MSFAAYLTFDGTCRAAMTRYSEIFGATDLQIMDAEAAPPGQGMEAMAGRVMHAQFSAGPGAPLMGADRPAGMPGSPQSATVFHAANSQAQAAAAFDALSEGGQVILPLAPTFWSPTFGMLRDRWAISWMISLAPGAA